MTIDDLKRIQNIAKDILADIDRVCKNNGIEYYLMFGTLLGAVRHGGIIPWDDDIDIGMTRENYLKFLDIAPKELDPRNEIVVMGSGSRRYLSELKIGRKGTKYYISGTEDLKVMDRVSVDIYLLDLIKPAAIDNARRRKIKKYLILTKLNWDEKRLIMRMMDIGHRRWRSAYKAGLILLHCIRAVLGEKFFERVIYLMFVDETGRSNRIGAALSYGTKTWDKNDGTVELEFDGHFYPAPASYNEILKSTYGNYMAFPPEEKRYKKHFQDWVFEEHT